MEGEDGGVEGSGAKRVVRGEEPQDRSSERGGLVEEGVEVVQSAELEDQVGGVGRGEEGGDGEEREGGEAGGEDEGGERGGEEKGMGGWRVGGGHCDGGGGGIGGIIGGDGIGGLSG